MKVIFHLGAPFTDNGLLVDSLQKNRILLSSKGISVPDPKRYRKLLREVSSAYKERSMGAEVEKELVLAISGEAQPEVLFLSNSQFVAANVRLFQGAQIWPSIQSGCKRLANLFPTAEIEFAICIRSPSTLIPRALRNLEKEKQKIIIKEIQVHAIFWSECLNRLRLEMPQSKITIWKHESAPFVWNSLLGAILSANESTLLRGAWDMISQRLPEPEIERIRSWLDDKKISDAVDIQRVMKAFYLKYEIHNARKVVTKPLKWTKDEIEQIDTDYEMDEDLIRQIPLVEFVD